MKKFKITKLDIFMLLGLFLIPLICAMFNIFAIILTIGLIIAFFVSIYKYYNYIDSEKEEVQEDTNTEYYNKKIKNFSLIYIWRIFANVSIMYFVSFVDVCACGHSFVDIGPASIFEIIDVLIYFFIFKRMLNKNIRENNNGVWILWNIIATIIYIILLLISKNDMEALHRML